MLPKIDKLRNIAKLSNAAVIGINESKLDDIRNDLRFDVKPFFPPEIGNVFFEILLPNTKPIVVGIIYRPPSQSEFLEIINTHFSKLDTNNNEIYILGNFNNNVFLNNSYIFFKKIICFKANRFLVTSKNTMNSVQCLV